MEGGTISPIRRQSAIVSPYNVHGLQPGMPPEMISQIESNRLRALASRHVSHIPQQPPSNSQSPHNLTNAEQGSSAVSLNAVPYHPVSHQGPQVKYVPHKVQGSQGHPAGSGPQFIHLGQGNLVVQKMIPQRQQAPVGEPGARISGQQIIYATQPVQVTGPRMSTLPPQPLAVKQQHPLQRPMLSPTGAQVRLAQSPGGQTMHYVPQGVMPGYMAPMQTFTPDGHRVVAQGPKTREFRGQQQSPAGRNMVHHMNDYRPRPGQLPPPPYSNIQRNSSEIPTPPKLQVNITVSGNGIVLSWDFEAEPAGNLPAIECYHLFASQDSPSPPTTRSEWKKIGVVKALPLPMACTLTQFVSGNSYHFAVLAIDVHGREGPMSNPCTVRLNK